jgi:hypothetical protein
MICRLLQLAVVRATTRAGPAQLYTLCGERSHANRSEFIVTSVHYQRRDSRWTIGYLLFCHRTQVCASMKLSIQLWAQTTFLRSSSIRVAGGIRLLNFPVGWQCHLNLLASRPIPDVSGLYISRFELVCGLTVPMSGVMPSGWWTRQGIASRLTTYRL